MGPLQDVLFNIRAYNAHASGTHIYSRKLSSRNQPTDRVGADPQQRRGFWNR